MPEQPRPRVPSHPHPTTAPHRRAPAPQPHQPPVRRNLFQSQLTRRPTPGAPPAGGGAGAEALRLEGCVDVLSDSDEIVVRDKKGEVEVEGPGFVEGDEGVDEREEMEKDRQRLADAVKHLRMNQSVAPDQTEYVLSAVKASLRAGVTALSEDNWMFEPEPQARH